ncbi:uncharacterized protein LOC120329396 [Styela clava]
MMDTCSCRYWRKFERTMQPLTEPSVEQNGTLRKFQSKSVRGLSIAVIVLGILSFGVGAAILTFALLQTCYWNDYQRRCDYESTYQSAGIWSGLAYIASGVIGLFSSRRKTTCFIVTLMIMSVVTAWIATCSIMISVMSQTDSDRTGPDKYSYPWTLRILDGCITLLSFIVFIISWVKFGFACHAVCCNGKEAYPKIKQYVNKGYQPLQSQPVMYANSSGPSSTPAVGMQFSTPPVPQPMEPIYLVQGRQVIGVLPQNIGSVNQSQMPGGATNDVDSKPTFQDPQHV